MTQDQQGEWNYRYHERLGILIDGVRPATEAEKEIARQEADDWLERSNAQPT